MDQYRLNHPVALYYNNSGQVCFDGPSDNFTRQFAGTLTKARTYTLPDKDGTVAMLSDIPNVTGVNAGLPTIGIAIKTNLNTLADQVINLTGGSKFVLMDMFVGNASAAVSASDLQIWTGPGRTGTLIVQDNSALGFLTSSSLALTNLAHGPNLYIWQGGSGIQPIIPNKVYLSFGGAQGSAATVDVILYGYIVG